MGNAFDCAQRVRISSRKFSCYESDVRHCINVKLDLTKKIYVNTINKYSFEIILFFVFGYYFGQSLGSIKVAFKINNLPIK